MSNRTLFEINHDFSPLLADDQFVPCLRRYLGSAAREDAVALEGFGVRIIAMRHHSNDFHIPPGTDGFAPPTPSRESGGRG